jgi:hypothetical protein
MADCRQVFGGCRGPMVIEAAAVAYVLLGAAVGGGDRLVGVDEDVDAAGSSRTSGGPCREANDKATVRLGGREHDGMAPDQQPLSMAVCGSARWPEARR